MNRKHFLTSILGLLVLPRMKAATPKIIDIKIDNAIRMRYKNPSDPGSGFIWMITKDGSPKWVKL